MSQPKTDRVYRTASRAARAILSAADTRLMCVDVGSAGGFHPRLQAIRDCAELMGIEADPDECARLNAHAAPGERHINAAVGAPGAAVVLELHRKRKTSSCFATDTARVSHFHEPERFSKDGEVAFRATSLDEICAGHGIERIDHLKIDVEGLELSVLQGYSGIPFAVETEVNFHPFRRGVPLFDAVMQHMIGRGFFLADLRRTFWSAQRRAALRGHQGKGFLIHGDALFLPDPFLEANEPLFGTPSQRARFLALLCLYGYAPEALMVTDELVSRGIAPADEAEAIARLVQAHWAARRKPRVPRRVLLLTERALRLPVAIRNGLAVGDFYQADGELGS